MKYVISTKALKDRGIKFEEALLIMLIQQCDDIPALIQNLIDRKLLRIGRNNLFGKPEYEVNASFLQRIEAALLSKDPDVPDEERLNALAAKLMELYPQGKKEGTAYYWRGNRKEIRERLQKFFKLYKGKFSDEEIINATKAYIASFNGNYAFMRVLKYFIIKDEKVENEEGKVVTNQVSDLATFIENADQEDLRNDWTSTLF